MKKITNKNIGSLSTRILFVTSLSYVIALENKLELESDLPSPLAVLHHSRIRRQFNPGAGFSPNFPNFPPPPPPQQQQQQQQQQQAQWGQQSPSANGGGFNGQRPAQNGQGQFSFQGSSNSQGQGQGQGQGRQQSSDNNLAGSSSTNNNNQAGSSNSNQQALWTSNQSDYQCVINNCRGQSRWNPVCGTDNLVYDNVAVLRCAQQCGRRISFNYYGTCVITTTAASK